MSPETRPKVDFVTRKWPPAVGGMETWSLHLSRGLAARVELTTYALPGRADGRPPGAAALLGFGFRTFLRRLGARRTVLVGDLASWPLALPGRGRVVLAAHGTDASYGRRRTVRGRAYAGWLRNAARLLPRATVIANSAETAAAAKEYGFRDLRIVPLGTDMTGPPPTGTHGGAILFAGRLIPLKGAAWFVREVLPLLPEHVTLQIAGTAWNKGEAAAVDHPRVRFLGPLSRDALAAAYADALCVVVPNIDPGDGTFEGFGLVAAEAAAAGGVVLASELHGLREAVRDGETGFHLPPGDAGAWAAKIGEVAGWETARRRAFLEAAMAAARARYSWDRVVDQVWEILTEPQRDPRK